MTTLTNYSELKQNIQDHAKRSDILSKLDFFIDMAESVIAQKLRMLPIDTRVQSVTSTSDRFMALPDGFLSMNKLSLVIDSNYYPVTAFPVQALNVVSTAQTPSSYSITSQVEFNCISDQAYTVEMQYDKTLTPLTTAAPTNDVLTKYPLLYLHGCMVAYANWSLNDALLIKHSKLFQAQMAAANKAERKAKHDPTPASYIRGMVV